MPVASANALALARVNHGRIAIGLNCGLLDSIASKPGVNLGVAATSS